MQKEVKKAVVHFEHVAKKEEDKKLPQFPIPGDVVKHLQRIRKKDNLFQQKREQLARQKVSICCSNFKFLKTYDSQGSPNHWDILTASIT